jgi:hypothetical protein
MKPGTIWLSADAERPVCVKRTIASEKRMLIVLWGIDGIAHYCRFPKDSTLDSLFFCEEVLRPLAQQMQTNSKNEQTLNFDSDGQCKGSHSKGNPREIGYLPIQRHAAATVSREYCTIRLFIFGWVKTQLERREYNGEDESYELYELVEEILTDLSIKMIERVLIDWMNRFQRLIDGNGDYAS